MMMKFLVYFCNTLIVCIFYYTSIYYLLNCVEINSISINDDHHCHDKNVLDRSGKMLMNVTFLISINLKLKLEK